MGVRVNRNRARNISRQPVRDIDKEDNSVVIDDVTKDKREHRRGVRKGLRKSAKKKASNGLLKQQILGRLVKTEPVQTAKEVEETEPVRERRVLRRKKGRSKPANTLEIPQTPESTKPVTSRHRFSIGRSYQRHSFSLQTEKGTPVATTTSEATISTTTVNPVLIWKQQAALAEKKSNPLGIGIRTGSAIGRGVSRKRKNLNIYNGKSTAKQVRGKNIKESQNQSDVAKQSNVKAQLPIRIKNVKSEVQAKKESVREKLSNNKKSPRRGFTFGHTNHISEESKSQPETERTSGRLVPSLKQRTHTLSIGNSNLKDEKVKSGRRLNLKKTQPVKAGTNKSDEAKANKDHKVVRRPRIRPSKSEKSQEPVPSHSRSSITTSVTSTSFSVTRNKNGRQNEGTKQNKISKKENNNHDIKLPNRGRARLPPRKGKTDNESNVNTKTQTNKKVDFRIKSKFYPRARSRGHSVQNDFNKRIEANSKAPTPSTRGNTNTKAKVQETISRLQETDLVTPDHKIQKEPLKMLEPSKINNTEVQKENMEEPEIPKIEINVGISENEKLNSKYNFRLEKERTPGVVHKDPIDLKTNINLEENKRVSEINEKQSVRSFSRKIHRPLSLQQDSAASKSSLTAKVDQRLKLKFDPRRRNKDRFSETDIFFGSKRKLTERPAVSKSISGFSEKVSKIVTDPPKLTKKSNPSADTNQFINLSTNQKSDEDTASSNDTTDTTIKHKERVISSSNVSKEDVSQEETKSVIAEDTLKGNHIKLEENISDRNLGRKSKLTERPAVNKSISGSRRRGHVPQRQKSDPESVSEVKDSDVQRTKSFNPRFRQRFTSRSKQKSNEDSEYVGSNARQSAKARSNLTVQTSPHTPVSNTPASAAPDKYLDIAYKHAEVTWAQDPFRKGSDSVKGPKFDIDYTKDPNYNSDDNEGPVKTFSNFGKEQKSIIHPTVPVRLPNIHRGSSVQITNVKLPDFQSVSSESFGSFSAPVPVFIPLFTPDLTKHVPGESPLFKPFTISVQL